MSSSKHHQDAHHSKPLDSIAEAHSDAPVGVWPRHTPRWQVMLSGMAWGLWAAFLVWMMMIRLQGS